MSAKIFTKEFFGVDAFKARRDLLGALSGARQREKELAWGTALVHRGTKRQVSMVFLAVLLINVGARAAWVLWVALLALPCGLVLVIGKLLGKGVFHKAERFFLSVIRLVFDTPSSMGLVFSQATGTWRLWEAMAACGPALAEALARRPDLAAQGWIWNVLGLNPFAIAGLGSGKSELAWVVEGLCGYGPWWSKHHEGYVLLTSPEMMAAAFRPLGLLGALRRGAAPWRSPWDDLLGQTKGACLWEDSPVSGVALSAWARAAWAQREGVLLGAEIDLGQALPAPTRERVRL